MSSFWSKGQHKRGQLVPNPMMLGLLIYVLQAWFSDQTVPGWTSLMVVVLLIGGVQLLCLGVFGEYLGRLYMESKKRPLFIIESVKRAED